MVQVKIPKSNYKTLATLSLGIAIVAAVITYNVINHLGNIPGNGTKSAYLWGFPLPLLSLIIAIKLIKNIPGYWRILPIIAILINLSMLLLTFGAYELSDFS